MSGCAPTRQQRIPWQTPRDHEHEGVSQAVIEQTPAHSSPDGDFAVRGSASLSGGDFAVRGSVSSSDSILKLFINL